MAIIRLGRCSQRPRSPNIATKVHRYDRPFRFEVIPPKYPNILGAGSTINEIRYFKAANSAFVKMACEGVYWNIHDPRKSDTTTLNKTKMYIAHPVALFCLLSRLYYIGDIPER